MSEMDPIKPSGGLEARYHAFLGTISQLRPSLHRYCARMTGSAMDGEDVVQEALFEAYRNLEKYDASRPLKPWLFRIAHNRCIDFLRKRGVQAEAESAAANPEGIDPAEPASLAVGGALEHLVTSLPPKERACVLLKDVFDYSLEEIAELVDSTVGGVKAALSRGREKLAEVPTAPMSARSASPELAAIMNLYVERFNRHDWDGVRELVTADARLTVMDKYIGKMAEATYFFNYERLPMPWKLAVGEVDGETVIVILRRDGEMVTPISMIRMEMVGGRIDQVRDYLHCPWIISTAGSVSVTASS
jgi:RNA polymerase sigma-70 factor, ECF subfamily